MNAINHNNGITGFALIFTAETTEKATGVVNFDSIGDIPVRQFANSDRRKMRESLKGPAANDLVTLITLLNALTSGDPFYLTQAKKTLEKIEPIERKTIEECSTATEWVTAVVELFRFMLSAYRLESASFKLP